MANSKIRIEFIEVPNVNEVILFVEDLRAVSFNETFKSHRNAANQTRIPLFQMASDGLPDRYQGFISEYYKDALNLDFNAENDYTIQWDNGDIYTGIGVVLITANYADAHFSVDLNTTSAIITITNEGDPEVPPPVEEINSVTPESLVFNILSDAPTVDSKNLTLVAFDNWTIAEPLPAWLSASQTSGTEDAVVVLTPINYTDLSGEYTTTLTITIGTDIFEIPVTLIVKTFLKNPFLQEDAIHFSKELKFMSFTSDTPGTYIDFNIEIKVFKNITFEEVIYNRTYKFPLFQGKGDFHVGTIVHDLFEEIQELHEFVPDLKSNYYQVQYRPSEITISFEEKPYGELTGDFVSYELPMFKMAKGYAPFKTENQLALLTVAQQEITRITPNSLLATSFIYIGTPRVIVKKNNVIIDDIEIAPDEEEQNVIYSYFRFVNNLKPGDSIELIIQNDLETRTQRFLVFPQGRESTYFFYENENGVLEPYEFTGRRRIGSNLKHTTTDKVKDLYSFASKVKSDNVQSIIVNTGDLLKTDHRIITEIISSPKVWCSFDYSAGPYFRVDATTTKIENQDTSSAEENFDIEFNILENANASIYPR